MTGEWSATTFRVLNAQINSPSSEYLSLLLGAITISNVVVVFTNKVFELQIKCTFPSVVFVAIISKLKLEYSL